MKIDVFDGSFVLGRPDRIVDVFGCVNQLLVAGAAIPAEFDDCGNQLVVAGAPVPVDTGCCGNQLMVAGALVPVDAGCCGNQLVTAGAAGAAGVKRIFDGPNLDPGGFSPENAGAFAGAGVNVNLNG